MVTYKTVLKDIQKHSPVPIKLIVGNKQFEGVEFEGNEGKMVQDIAGYYHCVEDSYHRYLLIKVSKEDIKFLDNNFDGEKNDIYAETRGNDFLFMGIGPKLKRSEVGWFSEEWKEYKKSFKSPQFKLIYL